MTTLDKVLSLLSGVLIGLAWMFPISLTGTLLTICGFILLLMQVQRIDSSRDGYLWIWIAGALSHALAFYWIYGTIRQFGNFPVLGAGVVFLLFVALSTIQFPLFLFVRRLLPPCCDYLCLRSPIAWISVELLAIRIFPWSAAHPMSAIPALIQLAEIGGIALLSFLCVWIADIAAHSIRMRNLFWGASALVLSSAIYLYGVARIDTITSLSTTTIPVALIQGNISLHDKHNPVLARRNLSQYVSKSLPYDKPGNLIVWPETVLMDWIREDVGHRDADLRLPRLEGGAALIFGTLSFASEKMLYNSAFAIEPDGRVPAPYHKRILMPFGEFTPFGDLLPFLRTLNNTAGDFTEGSGAPLIDVALLGEKLKQVRVTPLICYEDVLSNVANLGAVHGAQLLVNLTNDAWFGESVAPYQHQQIALFRTIETRRSLVRATNTGISSVISPTGSILTQLKPFVAADTIIETPILEVQTPFTTLPIQNCWLFLAVAASCLSIFRFLTIYKRVEEH